MHIASPLPHKVTCVLILVFASVVSTHSPAQSDQAKDKTPLQEKKSEEKTPLTTERRGGIEILSDTMGVDFGPYMKRLRFTVQAHWDLLIPKVALPPTKKSGTVTIELAVMKNGTVRGMKLVKSSGDPELDKAAWSGITDAIPLPTLPSEFKGDYLQLRCNFLYNPTAPSAMLKTSNEPNLRPATITRGTVEYVSDHEGLDGGYTKLILDAVQSSLQNLLQKAPPGSIKKSNQVAITFSILRNGAVKDIKLKKSSGNKSFDQTVWEAIRSSSPYQDLPEQFKGKLLKIRCEIDVP